MASFPLRRNADLEERAASEAPKLQAEQMLNVPLGTLIYRAGLLTQEAVQEALAESIREDKMLGEVLLERGMVEERELGRLLAGQKGLPFVELDRVPIDEDIARRLPENEARERSVLPVAVDPDGTPLVAVVNPDPGAVAGIAEVLGTEPHVGVAARGELLRAIDRVYGVGEPEPFSEGPGLRLAGDPEPVEAVESEVSRPVGEPVVESFAHAARVDDDLAAHEEDDHVADPVDEPEPWLRPEVEQDETEVDAGDAGAEEEDAPPPAASSAEATEPLDGAEEADDVADSDDGPAFGDAPALDEVPTFDEVPAFAWGEPAETDARDADDVDVSSFSEAEGVEFPFGGVFEHEETTVDLAHEEPAEEVEADEEHVEAEAEAEREPVLALVGAGESEQVEEIGLGAAPFAAPEPAVELDDVEPVVLDDQAEVAASETASTEGLPGDERALALVSEIPGAEAEAEVFLRLSTGERLSTGVFADGDEASAHAHGLLGDVKRGWWPHVEGRLIRPESIVSIDVESTLG